MHSIIAYKNGAFSKIGDTEFTPLIRFGIIDFLNPNEQEIKTFLDKIGFEVKDLNTILTKVEIPSIVHREEFLHLIYGTPIKKDRQIGTSPLSILLIKGYIILIHKDEVKSLSDLLSEIQVDISRISKLNISNIIYQIMADINDDFVSVVDSLGNEIESIEERLVKYHNETDVRRVYTLRKTLLYFKSVLRHNNVVVSMIMREDSVKQFIKENGNYNILYNGISQLIGLVDFYREMLTEVMQIYEGALANRLNEIMKYFGAVAALFLWPATVANIYGQNFKVIPFADHPFGFYIMLLIMMLGSILMYFYFKRKKWL
ncbi:hypothetical protein J4471_03125 [Candidatus Woesearchaeota archaeon]|nr:hypothetical protein [Candidatus Woesearchaeota archaeon]